MMLAGSTHSTSCDHFVAGLYIKKKYTYKGSLIGACERNRENSLSSGANICSMWCLHPYMVGLPSTCYRRTCAGQTSPRCVMNERINTAFIHDTGMWFPLWIKKKALENSRRSRLGQRCNSVRTTCVRKRQGAYERESSSLIFPAVNRECQNVEFTERINRFYTDVKCISWRVVSVINTVNVDWGVIKIQLRWKKPSVSGAVQQNVNSHKHVRAEEPCVQFPSMRAPREKINNTRNLQWLLPLHCHLLSLDHIPVSELHQLQ